jgi:hypothetical protein
MQVIEKNSLFAQVSGEQSAVVSGGLITAKEAAENVSLYYTQATALGLNVDVNTTLLLSMGIYTFQ